MRIKVFELEARVASDALLFDQMLLVIELTLAMSAMREALACLEEAVRAILFADAE